MKIRAQIILITLIPLAIVLGINYYQSLNLEELLNSKLEAQIDATKKRLLYNLNTNIVITKKIAQLLSKNYEVAKSITARDNDLLYLTSRFYIESKLISNITFIDKKDLIVSRGDNEYKFNDSAKKILDATLGKKKKSFTGLIKFDEKYQLATITPVYQYDVEFIGYVLVSHIIDKRFLNSIIETNEYLVFSAENKTINNFKKNTLNDIDKYTPINIELNYTTSKDIKNPKLIVFKNFEKEQMFIENSRLKQNIMIFLMFTIFPVLIIFFIKKRLDPLNNLNSWLLKFYKDDDITLGNLVRHLKNLPRGKNELSQIINSIIVTLETLNKTQENLINSKKEAHDANKMKTEFLSNMSHEIRTPLNAIIGFTEILLNTNLDNKQKNYLNTIKTSGKSLVVIINDILDLSKIESGKLNLKQTYVPMRSIFADTENLFKVIFLEKNLDFITLFHDDIDKYLFRVDEIRLKQIIINLIGNAIKFTEKGHVKLIFDFVKTDKTNANLLISIEDTGIGISSTNQKKIFDSFTQVSNNTKKHYGGTGLGLTITKKLLDLMGGNISLYSKKGKGSIFTIHLNDILIKKPTNKISKIKTDKKNIVFEKSKILVVDYINQNRNILKLYLEKNNLHVLEAKDSIEAKQIALEGNISLALVDVDVKMSDLDDKELIKQLKKKNTKIVAISTSALFNKMKKNQKSDFDGFIQKPIDFELLHNILKSYLKYKIEIKKTNYQKLFEFIKTDSRLLTELKNCIERFEDSGSLKIIEQLIYKISLQKNSEPLTETLEEIKDNIYSFEINKIEKMIYELKKYLKN